MCRVSFARRNGGSHATRCVHVRITDDADLLLMVTYKNWAALDGALEKNDSVAKQVEGSVSASNQAQADRAKIRRVLGSSTMQVLNLK